MKSIFALCVTAIAALAFAGCQAPGAANPVAFTLVVVASGSGTTIPSPGVHSYSPGTVVTLSAAASVGSSFTGWNGSAVGTFASMDIVMNADKNQIALFETGEISGDLYSAPGASDTAAGTISDPMSLPAAILAISAGNTIWLRGGSYAFSSQITIARGNNGTASAMKRIFAYSGEAPLLDFSSQAYGDTSTNPRGLQINGDFWHVRGIEAKGAADNGIFIGGNHNVVESCACNANRDSGLQLSRYASSALRSEWPSYNLILNCESFDSYDPATGENADGFACKLTTGPGNVFRGCISHNNIDDGWDLYTKTATGAIDPVVIDSCIAYKNGTLSNGTASTNGDRNGFKLGGESIEVTHTVTRCVAFQNGKNGFTWNSNPGAIRISNCLSFDNTEGNFVFGSNAVPTKAIAANNVSLWTAGSPVSDKHNIALDHGNSNCWWDKSLGSVNYRTPALVVSAVDFAGSLAAPTIVRLADHGIDFSVFALAVGSDCANAGVIPMGALPFDATSYYIGVPDLGAYESR